MPSPPPMHRLMHSRFLPNRWVNQALLVWVISLFILSDRLLLAWIGLPRWVPDPVLHYQHRPGATRLWRPHLRKDSPPKYIQFNQHGHHDDEFPVQKPAGELRGLFLGDSVTMGSSVTRHETFTYQLEQLLAAYEKGYQSFQMINAGVEGYGTTQELEVLRRSPRFEPDFIVIGFCLNDVTGPRVIDRNQGGLGWFSKASQHAHPLADYLVNETGWGRFMLKRQEPGLVQEEQLRYQTYDVRRMAAADTSDATFQTGWRQVLLDLEKMYALAREHDLPVVLVIHPYTFQFHQEDLQVPQRILTANTRWHGIDVIDMRPGIEERMRHEITQIISRNGQAFPSADVLPAVRALQTSVHFLDDNHYTPTGHRIVALELAAWMHRRRLVNLDAPAFTEEVRGHQKVGYQLVMSPDYRKLLQQGSALEALGLMSQARQVYESAIEYFEDPQIQSVFEERLGRLE